jgi:hypothetical protein
MIMICKLKTKAGIFGVVSGKIGGKYLYMRSTSKKACKRVSAFTVKMFNIRAKESPGFSPWGLLGANLHTDTSVDKRVKLW